LHTEHTPSDPQIDQIRAHLATYEAELVRLDALIESLTLQRTQVEEYIAPHRTLISLGRRLPQDILGEIFLACLPSERNAVMDSREAPLLLGRVCSYWRSIV
ncbi:hypothetical protein R3P38DRAFT_2366857, partial [Favolaschia claudopus]